MGVLSWFHERTPNRQHGRLGIQQGILLWVVTRSKEHIDALAGATFFMLNAEKASALFEKLSATKGRVRSMI
jgi:hypothetical protein